MLITSRSYRVNSLDQINLQIVRKLRFKLEVPQTCRPNQACTAPSRLLAR